jgi:predicted aminopeptidase
VASGVARSVAWLGVGSVMVLTGCADASYYLQSAQGHVALMRAAKPVDDWLADSQTPQALKARLALSQQIRRFAVTDLGLPDNASYHRYADLQRRAVVWNVVAAPELSLTLKTWCFPVMGCVGYRGYFEEAQARALAAELAAQGLEVSVYGVPAYSTLGWMNWAGGDPLLNTFINYPDGELARLIFHELAHQVVYAKDDTTFNESFATAVERLGGARWLQSHASAQGLVALEAGATRRAQFRALTLATRQALTRIYEINDPEVPVNIDKLAMKKVAFENFKSSYAQLKASWQEASKGTADTDPLAHAAQFRGFDDWVAKANNASFGAQAAYDELVPEFEALFAQSAQQPGAPWQRFYDAVKQLADLPKAQRRQGLKDQAHKDLTTKQETSGG